MTMSNRPSATSSSSSRRRSTDSTRSLDSTMMRASGKQLGSLFLQPLDAGTDGDEAYRSRAHFGHASGGGMREAAMMADQPPPEAMIDQPGIAIRACEAMPAGAAQRERRIAAAIEEQQAPARRARARPAPLPPDAAQMKRPRGGPSRAQIDRFDRRQMLAAETLRQMQPRVAAAPRIDLGFDRRRRRRQHDRDLLLARAHHRHVARVIVHAVLLLVGGIVLLIDDDQAEIGVGQKQRRARADDDLHFVRRQPPPRCARACAAQSCECHSAGRTPKRCGEAIEELRGERDFRHQDQRLLAAPDRFGDGLEIDFGLAGAGDAVDQRRRIAAA